MKSTFLDIKPPHKKEVTRTIFKRPAFSSAEEKPRLIYYHRPQQPPKLSRLFRVTFAAMGLLTLGTMTFYIASAVNVKNLLEESAGFIYHHVKSAGGALSNFETGKAVNSLRAVQDEILAIKSKMEKTGLLSIADIAGNIVPKVKSASRAFTTIGILSAASVSLGEDFDTVKNNAFNWMMTDRGNDLVDHLTRIRNNIKETASLMLTLKNETEMIDPALIDEFLPFHLLLYRGEEFLSSLIRWLGAPYEQHLLVFFQNPSEIRPGGGFIGSYADLTLKGGSVTDITVRDIYDPDGQLMLHTVPPTPLQVITKNWGARDANWFFDFPTSAQKVIHFLTKSKLYEEKNTTFDGAIALNVNVITTILETVGPIPLPEYDLTITSENFLREVQREVETGKDKAKGEPKKILKVLTPEIFEKLSRLDDSQKSTLLKKLGEHLERKDIMMYFSKDPLIQNYILTGGMGGDVMNLPEDFTGEYLAVVNANIAGGKTDAVMKEVIHFESTIGIDGEIRNAVTIERSHLGDKEKDPWYRTANKNYLQLFTTPGSKLLNLEGATPRTIYAPLDYEEAGYAIDYQVNAIEETRRPLPSLGAEVMEAFGKTVFSTWFNVTLGNTKTLTFSYTNPRKLLLNGPAKYQFVFDRQSGVNTSLSLTIDAPPGFKWLENDSSTFTKKIEDPPARVIEHLTLIPLPEITTIENKSPASPDPSRL